MTSPYWYTQTTPPISANSAPTRGRNPWPVVSALLMLALTVGVARVIMQTSAQAQAQPTATPYPTALVVVITPPPTVTPQPTQPPLYIVVTATPGPNKVVIPSLAPVYKNAPGWGVRQAPPPPPPDNPIAGALDGLLGGLGCMITMANNANIKDFKDC